MIFAVFGNAPIPFPRLAEAVERLAGIVDEPVIVQHGYTPYAFTRVQAQAFMDQALMSARLREAAVVVCHGGWGTISECLQLRKPVVAVPRRVGLEHNHDQDELVRVLENRHCILAVRDCALLPEAVEKARTCRFAYPERGDAAQTINTFLTDAFGI